MFVDETTFYITAGRGGDGCVAFRHEKFEPRGGPSGGDGGDGGDVILVASRQLTTLLDLHQRKHIKAKSGAPGLGSNKTGRSGPPIVLEVPAGTLVFNQETGEQLADLVEDGERLVIAAGGRGGWGNQHFANSRRQAPDFAFSGKPGEAFEVRLELKLLADVGIIGFPSVGKSTLISRISNARPKIAAYHFTTLAPNLGLVRWHDFKSFVVADLPGLIEGAHEGRGLGHQFLRHLGRVRVLVHVLECPEEGAVELGLERDPIGDYEAIRRELMAFDPEFGELPEIVVVNKLDLPATREAEAELRQHFEGAGRPFFAVSAVSHLHLKSLVNAMGKALQDSPVTERRDAPLERE